MAKRTMVIGGLIGLLLIGAIVGASLLVLDPGPEPVELEPAPEPPKERPPRTRDAETLAPEQVEAIEQRATAKDEPKTVSNMPTIRFEAYGRALDAVEWQPFADTFWRLSRELPRLGVAVTNGRLGVALSERLDELRRSVFDLSQPLLVAFPGEGHFSAWSHPAMLANVIAKTLEAADRPLTADQIERIHVLGETYIEREATAVSGLDNRAVYLSRTVPQVRVRTAFLAEIRGLLDASQLKVVGGGPYRNRIGLDPLAPGNIWVWEGEILPLPAELDEELENTVFGMMITWVADGRDETDATLRGLIRKWISSLDPADTSYRAGPLAFHGHLETPYALRAAASTGDLVASVLGTFEVTGDKGALLSYHREVLSPLIMPR